MGLSRRTKRRLNIAGVVVFSATFLLSVLPGLTTAIHFPDLVDRFWQSGAVYSALFAGACASQLAFGRPFGASHAVPPETTKETAELALTMFGPGEVQGVLGLLSEYGKDDRHQEPDRVHQAIIKLSEGDIDRLKQFLAMANTDYRSVLWWSEHTG